MPLKIEDIYTDILPVGKFAGYPTTFVSCTAPKKKSRGKSVDTVVSSVISMRNQHVSITGDRPLMQDESLSVVYELISRGFQVSIDADLMNPIEDIRSHRTFSYYVNVNCPSSELSKHNRYEVLGSLLPRDIVYFVIEDIGDYVFAKEVLRDYPTRADIVFYPSKDMEKQLKSCLVDDKLYRTRIGFAI